MALVAPDSSTHPNPIRRNFRASIKAALDACGADGFENDWEGPHTQELADQFLEWLIETRHLLGSSKYAVSYDTELVGACGQEVGTGETETLHKPNAHISSSRA